MAVPFVQGRLRGETLSAVLETECAQSGRAIRLDIDSEFRIRLLDGGPGPMIFGPSIDWQQFEEPNIVHAY